MFWLSAQGDKHAHMVLSLMGKGAHGTTCRCTCKAAVELSGNGNRYNQMHLPPVTIASILWGALILGLMGLTRSEAFYNLRSTAKSFPVLTTAVSALAHVPRVAALSDAFSPIRISNSDLLQRQELERSIQLESFQQFGTQKTGRLYNVTVPGILPGNARAVRLRSGSFKRYGIDINEFSIPLGCVVDPIPERILLVYTKFSNTSLFRSVPAGYVLASPVLSILVYDAGDLSSSQAPLSISVSTTGPLISVAFPSGNGLTCAYFSDNSTAVTLSDSVQGTCLVDRLGSFAVVRSALAPAPAPVPVEGQIVSAARRKKHSNTWKIVVGSVVGGLALLALLTALALGIGKRRKDARLSRMEYQTEHGETLQMANIRNSRVPTATNTRTQATLVNDYAV